MRSELSGSPGLGIKQAGSISAAPLISHGTLGESVDVSEPQFPHL